MNQEGQTETTPVRNIRRYILIGLAIINAIMIYSAPSRTAKLLHLVIIPLLAALYFIYGFTPSAKSESKIRFLLFTKRALEFTSLAMFVAAGAITTLSQAE